MADKKKPNTTSQLMNQDFLGDTFKQVNQTSGGGLYDKLGRLARQDAFAPVVDRMIKQSAWKPVMNMIKTAEDGKRARLAAYILANPEPDESQLHEGIGDHVSDIMKTNNLRFRELNKKLSYMNADHPEYESLVKEMNNINKTSIDIKADNDKLLNLRNLMKAEGPEGIEERTGGLSSKHSAMYDDILAGNKANFQNIDGKLHWVNPNAKEGEEPIAISSIAADTDAIYKNNTAAAQHLKQHELITKAKTVDPNALSHRVDEMFKGLGNNGVKSMIFDGGQGGLYDTDAWFDDWCASQGIEAGSTEAVAEYDRIRDDGVLTVGAKPEFGNVKGHFAKWYKAELQKNVGSMVAPDPSVNSLNSYEEIRKPVVNPKTKDDPIQDKELTSGENFDDRVNNIWKDYAKDETGAVSSIKSMLSLPEGITVDEAEAGISSVKLTDADGVIKRVLNKYLPGGHKFHLRSTTDRDSFSATLKAYQALIDQTIPEGVEGVDYDNQTPDANFLALLKNYYNSSTGN